jgi:ABC-2 type transport system ATP-binding protein
MSEKLMLSEDDMLKQVRIMSLGQKMKGELILSFIHLPQIVFLDEPTLGLDFMAQSAVRSFLLDYVKEQKASILLTSHYIKDIEELCERIVILNKGESIYYGTVSDLKRKASAVELDTIVENMYRESE